MSAILKASNLHFSYGQTVALRDASLELFAGEIVALIGPNGSGKSTLVRALFGALAADGDIRWNDKPLHEWRRRDLARVVAYLSQSPLYEPGQTVLDTLRLGRSAYLPLFGIESRKDIDIVDSIAKRLPLRDILHRPLDQLSGGQRQLAFVGRALVQQPRAILLDEPSTFLDLRHQVELMQLLRAIVKEQQVGVLFASHDLNLAAATADRLILLDRGSVAATGTPADVLDPALLQRVYGLAMQRLSRPGGEPIVVPAYT